MRVRSIMLKQAKVVIDSQPEIPYSVVTVETQQDIEALIGRIGEVNSTYLGKIYWASMAANRLVLVMHGQDSLGEILKYLSDAFSFTCVPGNTGYGVARYPMDGLEFEELVRLSAESAKYAYHKQSGYHISNRADMRRNLYQEMASTGSTER